MDQIGCTSFRAEASAPAQAIPQYSGSRNALNEQGYHNRRSETSRQFRFSLGRRRSSSSPSHSYHNVEEAYIAECFAKLEDARQRRRGGCWDCHRVGQHDKRLKWLTVINIVLNAIMIVLMILLLSEVLQMNEIKTVPVGLYMMVGYIILVLGHVVFFVHLKVQGLSIKDMLDQCWLWAMCTVTTIGLSTIASIYAISKQI